MTPRARRGLSRERRRELRQGLGTGGMPDHSIPAMCGRTTKNYTWEHIHVMYQLAVPAAIPNMQPSFNVCPTDPMDTMVAREGERELVAMRWGLVPFWWNKPLQELRLARPSRSSASRSRSGASSCRSRGIPNGRTRRAASSLGTSPRATARSCSRRPVFGTAGRTGRRASASARAR